MGIHVPQSQPEDAENMGKIIVITTDLLCYGNTFSKRHLTTGSDSSICFLRSSHSPWFTHSGTFPLACQRMLRG